ncbi:hypothetical protein FACS1894167_12210 [Synergistales bacterium]|nr:hypothetical protein FACS1894167_12210 [Synergistales bacterium]
MYSTMTEQQGDRLSREALNALPTALHKTALLVEFVGMPPEDAAVMLHVSAEEVYQRLAKIEKIKRKRCGR